jgi:hypothetical protein
MNSWTKLERYYFGKLAPLFMMPHSYAARAVDKTVITGTT